MSAREGSPRIYPRGCPHHYIHVTLALLYICFLQFMPRIWRPERMIWTTPEAREGRIDHTCIQHASPAGSASLAARHETTRPSALCAWHMAPNVSFHVQAIPFGEYLQIHRENHRLERNADLPTAAKVACKQHSIQARTP